MRALFLRLMTADDVRDPEDNIDKVWIRFGYGLDMVWICKFGLAACLSGSDMRIWPGGGFEWFGYANLDNFNDDLLNYPDGAFSRLLGFCTAPGFWINSMVF